MTWRTLAIDHKSFVCPQRITSQSFYIKDFNTNSSVNSCLYFADSLNQGHFKDPYELFIPNMSDAQSTRMCGRARDYIGRKLHESISYKLTSTKESLDQDPDLEAEISNPKGFSEIDKDSDVATNQDLKLNIDLVETGGLFTFKSENQSVRSSTYNPSDIISFRHGPKEPMHKKNTPYLVFESMSPTTDYSQYDRQSFVNHDQQRVSMDKPPPGRTPSLLLNRHVNPQQNRTYELATQLFTNKSTNSDQQSRITPISDMLRRSLENDDIIGISDDGRMKSSYGDPHESTRPDCIRNSEIIELFKQLLLEIRNLANCNEQKIQQTWLENMARLQSNSKNPKDKNSHRSTSRDFRGSQMDKVSDPNISQEEMIADKFPIHNNFSVDQMNFPLKYPLRNKFGVSATSGSQHKSQNISPELLNKMNFNELSKGSPHTHEFVNVAKGPSYQSGIKSFHDLSERSDAPNKSFSNQGVLESYLDFVSQHLDPTSNQQLSHFNSPKDRQSQEFKNSLEEIPLKEILNYVEDKLYNPSLSKHDTLKPNASVGNYSRSEKENLQYPENRIKHEDYLKPTASGSLGILKSVQTGEHKVDNLKPEGSIPNVPVIPQTPETEIKQIENFSQYDSPKISNSFGIQTDYCKCRLNNNSSITKESYVQCSNSCSQIRDFLPSRVCHRHQRLCKSTAYACKPFQSRRPCPRRSESVLCHCSCRHYSHNHHCQKYSTKGFRRDTKRYCRHKISGRIQKNHFCFSHEKNDDDTEQLMALCNKYLNKCPYSPNQHMDEWSRYFEVPHCVNLPDCPIPIVPQYSPRIKYSQDYLTSTPFKYRNPPSLVSSPVSSPGCLCPKSQKNNVYDSLPRFSKHSVKDYNPPAFRFVNYTDQIPHIEPLTKPHRDEFISRYRKSPKSHNFTPIPISKGLETMNDRTMANRLLNMSSEGYQRYSKDLFNESLLKSRNQTASISAQFKSTCGRSLLPFHSKAQDRRFMEPKIVAMNSSNTVETLEEGSNVSWQDLVLISYDRPKMECKTSKYPYENPVRIINNSLFKAEPFYLKNNFIPSLNEDTLLNKSSTTDSDDHFQTVILLESENQFGEEFGKESSKPINDNSLVLSKYAMNKARCRLQI